MADHSETDTPSFIEAQTPSAVATLNIDALYLTVYGGACIIVNIVNIYSLLWIYSEYYPPGNSE